MSNMSFSLTASSSSRRYSPSTNSKRKRGADRSFDRNDYPYSSSSKRSTSENHRSSREHITETYDLTTSSSSRLISTSSSSRKRRAIHSPSPSRSHSKRHSRSHSPRGSRSVASPSYYGRSNRADSSSRTARSPTPPSRKIDINDKITDTSLFAELVKDKRKRTQVLQQILDKKEEPTIISSGENSNSALNNNDLVSIDRVDNASTINSKSLLNGLSKDNNTSSRVSLVDIPMPNTSVESMKMDISISGGSSQPSMQINDINSAAIKSNEKKIGAVGASSTGSIAVILNDLNTDNVSKFNRASPAAAASMKKPKSLAKLPMPPGVNVAELEDITTPSPTRSSSSPLNSSTKQQLKQNPLSLPGSKTSTPNAFQSKKGLLNLPMPPMVPGSEDLSGDDDYISSPNPQNRSKSNNSMRKEIKRKRPTILNRRDSRSLPVKDWGERCVDVFEVIAQIGEGTYGQVIFKIKLFINFCSY